jgi:hypothetical protein
MTTLADPKSIIGALRKRWRTRRTQWERSRAGTRSGRERYHFWNSLWEVLNRPFVIFAVGTIVAGTFIAVRDASTRCYDELAKTEDTLLAALDELLDRRIAFWEEVIAAKSLGELQDVNALERRYSRSFKKEFKEIKVDALERKIYQLSNRFRNDGGEQWSPWEITMDPVHNIDDQIASQWEIDEDLDVAKEHAKALIEAVVSLRGDSGPNVF